MAVSPKPARLPSYSLGQVAHLKDELGLDGRQAAALGALEKEMAGLRSELRRARVELKIQKATGADLKRLETQVQSLEETLQECQKESEKSVEQVDRLGTASIDLVMMARRIQNLEEFVSTLLREREKLKLELRAAPRIALLPHPNMFIATPEPVEAEEVKGGSKRK